MSCSPSPLTRNILSRTRRSARGVSVRNLFGIPSPFASTSTSSSSSSSSGSSTKAAKGTLTKQGSLSVYQETRELNYDPRQLYSVIADVDAYKSFLPFTSDSRILSASVVHPNVGTSARSSPSTSSRRPVEAKEWLQGGEPGEVWDLRGELKVGALNYNESYVSRIMAKKYDFVSATANNSNIFKHLETKWSLEPLPNQGSDPRTRVKLYLAYSFISPFHAMAVSALWEKVSGLMIDGFQKRVESIHGSKKV